MSNGNDRYSYDVVVAGGGPAGSLCGFRLALLGWRVLLVDWPHSRPKGTDVDEMLAPEGVWLLERLGLSATLDGPASTPCCGILSYWNSDEPEFSDLTLMHLRAGRTIDRRVFDGNLRKMAASAGADVHAPARLRFLEPRGADSVRLLLETYGGGMRVEIVTSFVVEASGRSAVMGVAADECAQRLYFDRLIAIPITVRQSQPSDGQLRVIPSRSGWWYTLAARESEGIAVYLTDGDLLPREPSALAIQLEREWRDALHGTGHVDTRRMRTIAPRRDARTGCRRVLQRGSWLPIGDSAFTLDPLSGSGLTRGLRMADRAASSIAHYLATGSHSDLSVFAVALCEEFANAQEVSHRLYARCARRFPDSQFWRRRLRERRRHALGLNQASTCEGNSGAACESLV